MRKFTIRIMAAAGILIFIGAAFCAAGWLLGGEPGFYLDKSGMHTNRELRERIENEKMDTLSKTELEGIRSMDIGTEYENITVKPSDDGRFYLEYQIPKQEREPAYTVKDGVLTMDVKGRESVEVSGELSFFMISSVMRKPGGVTFYVPQTLAMTKIGLNTVSGDIAMDGIKTPFLAASSDSGQVTLKDVTADTMVVKMINGDLNAKKMNLRTGKIQVEYGDTQLELVGREASYNYNLKSEYGAVYLNSRNFEDESVTEDNGTDKSILLTSKTGRVEITTGG